MKREDIFITTKVYVYSFLRGTSSRLSYFRITPSWNTLQDDCAKSLELSLTALGTTYADLLLIHWPV